MNSVEATKPPQGGGSVLNVGLCVMPKRGDFIRVRRDHSESFRAGLDGMVIDADKNGVSLVFGFDRYNQLQNTICVGPEEWMWEELDHTSATHNA